MSNTNKPKYKAYNITNKEMIIFIIVGICIMFTPFLLSLPAIGFNLNDENLARIGTALSITSPFIGIGGAILVYMAFKEQLRANLDINDKFQKQDNDQMFFRIIDDLQDKVNAFAYNNDSGNHAIYQITDRLQENLRNHSRAIAIWAIENREEEITHSFFLDEFELAGIDSKYKDVAFLKRESQRVNEYYDYHYDQHYDFSMKFISNHFFYIAPFELRIKTYKGAYINMYSSYAGMIEGYFRNLRYILKFLGNITDVSQRNIYGTYLTNNISAFEKALIFYYCAANPTDDEFIDLIKKYQVLTNVEDYINALYNLQDITIAENELDYILAN